MIELFLVVKATIVMVLALGGAYLIRNRRASIRHVLLASAFLALIALPIAAALLPPVSLEIPIIPATGVRASAIVWPDSQASGTTTVVGRSPQRAHTSAGRGLSTVSALTILRLAWAVGTVLFLVPIVAPFWCLRSIRRDGLPWPRGEAIVRELAREGGIPRHIDLRLHETIQAPAMFGCVRPLIALPSDAPDWNEADVRRALVHELTHIRRSDWPVHLVARVVSAIYWFHPLVWSAWRLLRLDAERACDDAVLGGTERTAYADQLVTLARRLSRSGARPLMSMASRSDLHARVAAVLDGNRPRGRAGMIASAVTLATALSVGVLVAPLRAVGRSLPPMTQIPTTPAAQLNADSVSARQLPSQSPVVSSARRISSSAGMVRPSSSEMAPSPKQVDAQIVATVNGESFTTKDVRSSQALVAAVDEMLVAQRGRQLGYILSNEQFANIIVNIRRDNKLETDEQFQAALEQEGLTIEDLRNNLEHQMIRQRVEQNEVLAKLVIADDEAQNYYDAHPNEFPLMPFEQARDQIKAQVIAARSKQEWDRYVDSLRSQATIEWNSPDLKRAYESALANK